eukprot:366441-Chlamydomonas_euryale.AAC.20
MAVARVQQLYLPTRNKRRNVPDLHPLHVHFPTGGAADMPSLARGRHVQQTHEAPAAGPSAKRHSRRWPCSQHGSDMHCLVFRIIRGGDHPSRKPRWLFYLGPTSPSLNHPLLSNMLPVRPSLSPSPLLSKRPPIDPHCPLLPSSQTDCLSMRFRSRDRLSLTASP